MRLTYNEEGNKTFATGLFLTNKSVICDRGIVCDLGWPNLFPYDL